MNGERLVTYDTAMAELPALPEPWRRSVYQTAAQSGLTESDPLWWFLVAQTKLMHSFLAELPTAKPGGSNGNGDTPAPLPILKSSQIDGVLSAIKSLPQRGDIEKIIKATGQGSDNPELTAFLDEWRVTKAQQHSTKGAVKYWLSRIAGIGAIAAAVFGAGYLVCWMNIHQDADNRVDRVIAAQPFATHVPLWLSSHQASLTLGPLQPANGHGETRGIIIRPGDLKLSSSWVSTDGDTVIPIQ